MNIRNKISLLFLIAIGAMALAAKPAQARSFNAVLVLPLSGGAAEARQYRQGFIIATAERDYHPDQESDGHLGGLDVYVQVADGEAGDLDKRLATGGKTGKPDIVAVFGPEATLERVRALLGGTKPVLQPPGRTPFANPGQPGVARFTAAYQKTYGQPPSAAAAQGYNAARRIATAVRAQGGVGDTAGLRRNFEAIPRGFAW